MSYNEIDEHKINEPQRRICEIDQQIEELERKKYEIKQDIKKEATKQGWFSLLQTHFDSSSQRTPEYLSFHRLFKNQFSKLLKETFPIKQIQISKPNHFDVTGFFQLENGNIYYFSIGDLRWSKNFLIRTAESFKDYHGGSNQYADHENYENFLRDLKRVVK